jgi:hypothetical protein
MSYDQKNEVDLFASNLDDLSFVEKKESKRESFFSNLDIGGFFSRTSSIPKLQNNWGKESPLENVGYRPDQLGDGVGELSHGDPQYTNSQGWSRERVDNFNKQFFNPENPNVDLKTDTRLKLFEIIEKDLQLNGGDTGYSKAVEEFLNKFFKSLLGTLGIFSVFVASSKKYAPRKSKSKN